MDSIFVESLYSANIPFSFTKNPLLEVKILDFILVLNLKTLCNFWSIMRLWLFMEEVISNLLSIF